MNFNGLLFSLLFDFCCCCFFFVFFLFVCFLFFCFVFVCFFLGGGGQNDLEERLLWIFLGSLLCKINFDLSFLKSTTGTFCVL